MEVTRLKAAINGRRSTREHAAVPITPAGAARAAVAAAEAGAEAVHVHPRDPEGTESLSAPHVAATVAAIRAARPGLPVGVSTGLWMCGDDPGARLAQVRRWGGLTRTQRPDFASVNLSEPGFADLAGLLLEQGIGVEAGVWSPADAEALAASGLGASCVRLLVEIIDAPAAAAARLAADVLDRLDELGQPATRLLHGEEEATWPLIAEAGRRRLPTRIGLEDVLHGPAGEPVGDNAHLVRLASEIWAAAAR